MVNSTLYVGTIYEMLEEYEKAKKNYEAVLDMREFGNSHGLADAYLGRIEEIMERN